jgi:hypothetical protein
MARPERKNVDYFPFYVEDGQKMFYIEETYGNDGFAVFIKILRELAKVENHYLDLSKPTQLMFLSAKCKVQKDVLESIIIDLVNLEKFDSELWSECKVIWCQDFIDSIQDAYRKRNNLCMTKQGLISILISLGRKKQIKVQTKGGINTQIKENKTKKNKTKEELKEDFDSESIIDDIVFPFNSNEFNNSWNEWKEYKKTEHKFSYKSKLTELKTIESLFKDSNGSEKLAIEMINNAIAKNWKGIYKINNDNNGKQFTKPNANEALENRLKSYAQSFGVNQEPIISETISERTSFDDYEEIP